jgi:1,4-alpha-glucan branching enzyme
MALRDVAARDELHPDAKAVEALAEGRHGDPFGLLGMRGGGGSPVTVRVFAPDAESVAVIDTASGKKAGDLEKIHPAGFFSGALPRRTKRFAYRLKMRAGKHEWEIEDPYRFPPILGALDIHLLAEGKHRRTYEKLGAHPVTIEGVPGVAFAVWAPNARRVSVVGEFNGWDGRRHPMRLRHEAGVWEIFIPHLERGTLYKYEILGIHGRLQPLKADPVGFAQEHPPSTASKVHGLIDRTWQDGDWMARRHVVQERSAPISIYEVHLGSWRRHPDDRVFGYDELADSLIPYATEMGFTHLELLPISEHPFSGSWGYQPIGLYAPTSRFGDPDGFARLVERCHQAGLGVIIDWVPAHFPTDEHGLARFDGTALYEHEDPRLGFHRDWSTLIYNFGRREVANYLLANALYWLDRFHVDALRVDAVASMLYLDYSREPGEWIPNVYGGNENLEAIAFLKELNTRLFGDQPGATSMAEESTAWPGVSRPVHMGGLGFGYKWNMGWMHDTLEYIQQEPVHRKYHHHQLTFGLLYAFSENFILPLSHDEVVHGKGSMLGKMPGDRWQKFANLRAYYGFMWTHPGKKLIFMGGELGQEREWSHDRELDWWHLQDSSHAGLQRLVRDLNRLYRDTPALHQLDCEAEGFQWVEGGDADNSVLAYLRKGTGDAAPVLVVSNFTPVVRPGYRVGVPAEGLWAERLNTDAGLYGGSNVGNSGGVQSEPVGWHGWPHSLALTLPPLATVVLQYSGRG